MIRPPSHYLDHFTRVAACVGVLVLILIGCGGGGGTPGGGGGGSNGGSNGGSGGSGPLQFTASVSASSPVLDDGGHFAALPMQALKSGTAQVSAASSAFDPILVIEQLDPDGTSEVVAEDDDGGGGTTAAISFSATAGVQYTLIATSPAGDPRGDVTFTYPSDTLAPALKARSTGTNSLGGRSKTQ